jgi:hypothetical protein
MGGHMAFMATGQSSDAYIIPQDMGLSEREISMNARLDQPARMCHHGRIAVVFDFGRRENPDE